MIDCRSPKYRRKGERDGKIDWKAARHTLWLIVVMALCNLICFWAGSHYAAFSDRVSVAITDIYKEYKSYRVYGH